MSDEVTATMSTNRGPLADNVDHIMGKIHVVPAEPAGATQAKSPLRETSFTTYPRPLDDLAIALSKHRASRSLSRSLTLVALDLAKYTDNAYHDAVVTNKSIAARRAIGEEQVKAVIELLVRLKILRKEDPNPERLRQLKGIPGGFSGNRRRLVWNPQAMWLLPTDDDDLVFIEDIVRECRATAPSVEDDES